MNIHESKCNQVSLLARGNIVNRIAFPFLVGSNLVNFDPGDLSPKNMLKTTGDLHLPVIICPLAGCFVS